MELRFASVEQRVGRAYDESEREDGGANPSLIIWRPIQNIQLHGSRAAHAAVFFVFLLPYLCITPGQPDLVWHNVTFLVPVPSKLPSAFHVATRKETVEMMARDPLARPQRQLLALCKIARGLLSSHSDRKEKVAVSAAWKLPDRDLTALQSLCDFLGGVQLPLEFWTCMPRS